MTTKTIGYEYDDGGRAAAGYKGQTGDCVARALAIITGKPYRKVYADLAERNFARYGKRTARQGIHKVDRDRQAADYGLVKIRLPRGARPTYSEAFAKYGDCFVTTTRHSAAIVDGALRDTFDGRAYEWDGETRERKAASVWVRKAGKPAKPRTSPNQKLIDKFGALRAEVEANRKLDPRTRETLDRWLAESQKLIRLDS